MSAVLGRWSTFGNVFLVYIFLLGHHAGRVQKNALYLLLRLGLDFLGDIALGQWALLVLRGRDKSLDGGGLRLRFADVFTSAEPARLSFYRALCVISPGIRILPCL